MTTQPLPQGDLGLLKTPLSQRLLHWLAAEKYLGADAARELAASVDQPRTRQARIVLQPAWAGLLDFQTRLPSAQGGPSA